MKVRNLNNSSVKTRKLIKDTFIQMLADHKDINELTVSELVKRADISRATFYTHFDDIYGVVKEFEDELIENFFTNARLLASDDYQAFFKAVFDFLSQNDEKYKLMCKSDIILFSVNKLAMLATGKLMELAHNDPKIKDKTFVELEISVFVDGVMYEYVKYCRGIATTTPADLYNFSLEWYKRFKKERC